MKLYLAQRSYGRIILHAVCLTIDHKWAWHVAGIVREFRKA